MNSIEAEMKLAYLEECPTPVPDCSFLMEMSTPDPHSFVQKALYWLVRIDANEGIAVQLWLDWESLSSTGQILILGVIL